MLESNDSNEYEVIDCEEGSLLDQQHIRIPLIIFYLVVFGTVALGNAFTIIVICIHKTMRTTTNFFLANLAFADMLVSIFCILQNMFHIVGSKNGNWPLGELICKLYVLFLHLIPSTSIGILICVSVEKYLAVSHPLLALKILTNKLRIIMIITIWSISIIFNLPYYFTTKEIKFFGTSACIRDMNNVISMKFMITSSFIIWYCAPLITIAILYFKIGKVLWKPGLKPLEIRYSSDSYGGPPTLTINYDRTSMNGNDLHRCNSNSYQTKVNEETSINSDMYESRKKIIRLLIAIVCSFAVLTLPHHARLLYSIWTDNTMCNSTWHALLQPMSYLFLFMSSGVNPILYAFLSQRFREAVKDILNCKNGKNKRKNTRTRTFISDIPEISRSPSLLRRYDYISENNYLLQPTTITSTTSHNFINNNNNNNNNNITVSINNLLAVGNGHLKRSNSSTRM